MENNIPTAEEFFTKYADNTSLAEGYYDYLVEKDSFKEAMIEFAKIHVEAALKAANLNVKLLVDNNEEYREPDEAEDLLDYYECGSDTVHVSSSSILKAYPLTNIK